MWTRDSPYVRSRRARGFTLSPGYLATTRTNLLRHVLPAFGKRRVAAISPSAIEGWRLSLFDEGQLAPRTINLATRVLSVMLAAAEQGGYTTRNLAAGIGKLAERPGERGVPKVRKVRAVFADDAIASVWGGDLGHRALRLLAAVTGLRTGEALGLRHAGSI